MLKVTFHLTISMCGQRATSKIQWNNYHHRSCGPSLTGKTSSVSLIFTHGTHRNVKNSWVRSSLYSTTFSSFHRICHFTTCRSSMNAGPPWLFNYIKQQSLVAYSNVCYLL